MNFKNILQTLSITLMSVITFTNASAVQLSPEQAIARVRDAKSNEPISRSITYTLSYTEKANGDNILYVFNSGVSGFVIASADDRLPARLGYSAVGAFDYEKVSPEMKWWLEQYAIEASYYLNHTDQYVLQSQQHKDRQNINHLLTTLWDQDEPYNLYCPLVGNNRCVTGCVATAMAQVIKYYSYPVNGTGMATYLWNGQSLSFDYGHAEFNYDDMLDAYSYYDSATPSQNEAVANLMYACGVGVNMNYSPRESGTGDLYIAHAFKTYFNYDPGVKYLKRIYFTNSDWEDLVYGELEAGRPVIYSGQAPKGGHAFVCDGYEDGYFHINWGWSGRGNGYFLLSALDPGLEGIGGFAGGYNSDQSIICGIKPDDGTNTTPWYPIYATGGIKYDGMQGNFAVNISLTGNEGIYNFSPDPVPVTFYLKAESETGEITYSERGVDYTFRGAQGQSVSGIGGLGVYVPQGLSEGKYKATLAFKTPEGNWQDILIPLSGSAYFDMTVDVDGKISFTDGEPAIKPQLEVISFAPDAMINKGEPAKINLLLRNEGEVEYSGAIYAKIYAHDTSDYLDEFALGVSVAAGEDFDGYVNLVFNLENGLYDIICYDMYGKVISEVFPLWIGQVPAIVTSIELDKTEAEMEIGSTLQLTATVYPEDANNKVVLWTSSNPEIANVDEFGTVTAFNEGEVVITATSQDTPVVQAFCYIKVLKTDGIEDIMIDVSEADIYSIDGLLVKKSADSEFISALPKGIYIIFINGRAHKVIK